MKSARIDFREIQNDSAAEATKAKPATLASQMAVRR